MKTMIWLLLIGIVLASCNSRPTPTPEPTPIPPQELRNLPRLARTRCTGDPNLDKGSSALFEMPGVYPRDTDSADEGARGRRLHWVAHCTEVEVLKAAWSEWDQEFWVLVRVEDAEGWIWARWLEFTPPSDDEANGQ